MPVVRGTDSDGPYYSWGVSGARYHYPAGDVHERELAKSKAKKQGKAIKSKKPKSKPKKKAGSKRK